MSPRKTDARERVVVAAVEMLARHGLNATSIREMAKKAEAPLGSTYHHFPDGKQEVVVEAVRLAGRHVDAQLRRHSGQDAAAALADFFQLWRNILLKSDFHVGCPVMAIAVEEPIDEPMEEAVAAAAAVFASWRSQLAALLERAGRTPEDAAGIATLLIASIEGVLGICRVEKSIVPFDQVSRHLLELILPSRGR